VRYDPYMGTTHIWVVRRQTVKMHGTTSKKFAYKKLGTVMERLFHCTCSGHTN